MKLVVEDYDSKDTRNNGGSGRWLYLAGTSPNFLDFIND